MEDQTIKTDEDFARLMARRMDVLVREIMDLRASARDARTVSKIMLLLKLEAIELKARQVEEMAETLVQRAVEAGK